MVLKQTSGGWTAAEGDPAVTSDVGLIEAASETQLSRPTSRPASFLFQALMVLAAAMVAGFIVFFLVRAAVSSDANPDEQAMDLNELPTVGLDPENRDGSVSSDESSSRSGSQRDTLEDGIPEETPAATPTDTAEDGDNAEATNAETPSSTEDATGDEDVQPGDDTTNGEISESGDLLNSDSRPNDPDAADDPADVPLPLGPIAVTSTTTPLIPVPSLPGSPGVPIFPTTAVPAPTTTPTTAAPTTQATSAPPTTSQPTTTPQPTTATTVSTTTAPTPTTGDTTTTTTTIGSTTTTTSLGTGTTLAAPPLISAPVEGSQQTWEDGVEFSAETVPDAVRYCWKLESANRDVEECSDDPGYTLPGGEAGVDPGIVIVTLEAQDLEGGVLNSETMTLKVIARDLIDSPSPGATYDQDDDLRVDFNEIPTATEYCVTLTQDSVTLPTTCETGDRVTVPLRRFADGPITVQAEVMRGQQIIGIETIEIAYND